ncbi:MAG: CocE/NonD family hydrolase, partial [Pirellulaceae bacterium]
FVSLTLLGLMATCVLAASGPTGSQTPPVSSGERWVRQSQYITVRDGTRLAADIIRPVRDGAVVTQPLPVVWILHRYGRASIQNGSVQTIVDQSPWLRTLLEHGYIIVAVDARGSGASFGSDQGMLAPAAKADTYDVTEWLAAQPWSDGNIGMFGRSYMGAVQYIAASMAPPHLRAIFPEMFGFDMYTGFLPGGIPRSGFLPGVETIIKVMDRGMGAVPVDDDPHGTELARAVEEHRANAYGLAAAAQLPFRDEWLDANGQEIWAAGSPSPIRDAINRSNIPIFHLGGWYDTTAGDTPVWYANLDNPQRLIMGPWYHGDNIPQYDGSAHLRWFDYWLKNIDNGIMAEPPISYFTIGAPAGQEWRSTWDWPPPNAQATNFYLRAGPTGTIASASDGSLSLQAASQKVESDTYVVNYDSTSGQAGRWAFVLPGTTRRTDMSELDRTGLTYTTLPLPTDIEITGYPIVHLWVTASAPDADFFVFLQDIDAKGASRPIGDGALRASYRATAKPPFENFGQPYHTGLRSDVAPLPPEPVELAFSLNPTSYIVHAGHRLRLTITGADRGAAQTPVQSPPPTVQIFRGSEHSSRITLPIVPSR